MFCEKCGKENPDSAKFCEGCGSAMETVEAPAATAPVAPEVEPMEPAAPSPIEAAFGGLNKKYFLPIVGAVAVVVVVVLLAVCGMFKPGPVKVVEKYLTGTTKYNAKKAYEALEACPYISGDKDKDEIKEELEDKQEFYHDLKVEHKENDIKLSFKKVRKVETYKKDEVDEIEDALDEYGYDVDEYPLQGVARVKALYTEIEDGDKYSDTREYITIKVKGKWYVMYSWDESDIDDILG
ncbi:MAG: zinc-ribbon domain-containing protein [Clostridia bacterium]|nr:zinc-ribbon domain-containing protein [Clostridia bacterium]